MPASSMRARTGSNGISTSSKRFATPPSVSSRSSAGTMKTDVIASAAARRAIACSSAPVSGLSGRSGSVAPKRVAALSSIVCDRSAGLTM